jgi:hypothetical protein
MSTTHEGAAMGNDRGAEIFSGNDRAEKVFEELAANGGLSAESALWLHQERERLVSLAHDFYIASQQKGATS